MLERVKVKSGTRFEVVALGRRPDELTFVEQYLVNQTPAQRKKILKAIEYLADHGPSWNEEKCRKLHGPGQGLYELKEKPTRIVFFYDGPGMIVLTHAFDKRRGDMPRGEIARALALKREYAEQSK